jgi:hypothetical protein
MVRTQKDIEVCKNSQLEPAGFTAPWSAGFGRLKAPPPKKLFDAGAGVVVAAGVAPAFVFVVAPPKRLVGAVVELEAPPPNRLPEAGAVPIAAPPNSPPEAGTVPLAAPTNRPPPVLVPAAGVAPNKPPPVAVAGFAAFDMMRWGQHSNVNARTSKYI